MPSFSNKIFCCKIRNYVTRERSFDLIDKNLVSFFYFFIFFEVALSRLACNFKIFGKVGLGKYNHS